MTKRVARFRGMEIEHNFKTYSVECTHENCSFKEEGEHLYELKDKCGKHFDEHRHSDFSLSRNGSVSVNR